ncbi:MAG: hypothetical protein SVV80_13545 [Planctomycetota bacterium]|nr:hypothetical protein [Planctomycetota bacterium]
MEEKSNRFTTLFLLAALVILPVVSGCTLVTQDQKNWVYDKANRSETYVVLMDKGQTTPEQDKEWIRSQNESWRLWADKMQIGLAAPPFAVKEDK